MPTKPAPPVNSSLAYSYLRFSSIEQAKGDSVRRQTELRDGWLARNKIPLDDSTTLRDNGRSAFTGEHRKNPDRHALAAFLRLVETGKVPRGSYLIVENLDRLSREHIQSALILFLNLLQAGIRVVQLLPAEQVYDSNSESMAIMMAIMELSRGNSESRMKSERIGRAWADLKRRAASEKIPITQVVPAWLKVEGPKIVTVPKRAEVVKRVYRLVLAGHGLVSIAHTLTTEKVPTFGSSKMWNPSSLYKMVHSRAAAGEYQPRKKKGRAKDGDPIPGYFPAVVSDSDWWAAQAALKSRHNGGRRSTHHFNPFAGLLIDARDGGKMYATGPGKRANMTLVNYAATRGSPTAKFVSFPLAVFTEAVLTNLREISIDEIDGTEEPANEIPELEARKADLEGRIAGIQAELTAGDVKSAVAVLRHLEASRDEVDELLAAARARAATTFSSSLTNCQDLIDAIRKRDTEDTRARLKAAVRRMVEQVTCLFVARGRSRVAAVQIAFKGTAWRRGFFISYTQGRGNAQVQTPASWAVISGGWETVAGETDLRKKADVKQLERDLTELDLTKLC